MAPQKEIYRINSGQILISYLVSFIIMGGGFFTFYLMLFEPSKVQLNYTQVTTFGAVFILLGAYYFYRVYKDFRIRKINNTRPIEFKLKVIKEAFNKLGINESFNEITQSVYKPEHDLLVYESKFKILQREVYFVYVSKQDIKLCGHTLSGGGFFPSPKASIKLKKVITEIKASL